MVKVKKFSNWLEQRDADTFKSVQEANFWTRVKNSFSSGGTDPTALAQTRYRDLANKVYNWVVKMHQNIAVAAETATGRPGGSSGVDDGTHRDIISAVDRMVGAMARKHGMFSDDAGDKPSDMGVSLADAKLVTDYVLGVNTIHEVPTDVRWPELDDKGNTDAQFPHHDVDDGAFRAGQAAAPGTKVHPPGHAQAGQPIPGKNAENRQMQQAIANLALKYRITNPSRLVHEMVAAFPRDLKLPANWGQLASKFSTDYTAYFLPQVVVGNMRSMVQSGRMGQYIADKRSKLHGDFAPDSSKAPVSATDEQKAQQWIDSNTGATTGAGQTLQSDLDFIMHAGGMMKLPGRGLNQWMYKTNRSGTQVPNKDGLNELHALDDAANRVAMLIQNDSSIPRSLALAIGQLIDNKYARNLIDIGVFDDSVRVVRNVTGRVLHRPHAIRGRATTTTGGLVLHKDFTSAVS